MLRDIDQLKAACSKYNRGAFYVTIATIFTVGFCYELLNAFRPAVFFRDQFGPISAEVLVGLWPSPAVVVLFIGIRSLSRWIKDVAVFRCPHCSKCIFSRRRRVIATGDCYHCGRRIVIDTAE